jgi:hypothetical protein
MVLGLIRTADDVRAVADELRDAPGEGDRAGDLRFGRAIERLTMIHARLARAGLQRSADDVSGLLDELRGLL